MRPLVRLLLFCFVALIGAGAPPARAARSSGGMRPDRTLSSPYSRAHPLNGYPFPDSPLFDADRPLLQTLLSHPLVVSSTAAPTITDPAAPAPRLNNLIVGNITGTTADTRYSSDLPASTLLFVSSPLAEFSSSALTTDHRQTLSGLAPATAYRLRALAVTGDLGLGALPDVVFTMAQPAQPGGMAQIVGGVADLVNDPDDPNAVFAVISFRNVGGGDATDVTLTALNVSPGWSFTSPLPTPLDLGALGRGASGIILTRLSFTGTPPATAPLLTGAGTFTVAGGAPQSFNLGGTVPLLYVTKSADVTSVHPNDMVTFTLTVTNRGLGAANGLGVGDVLPQGLTFVAAANNGLFHNGVVAWTAPGLAPGATGSVSFTAQVAGNLAAGTNISNIPQARSGEIPNAVAGAPVVITVVAPPPPQLQLIKSADLPTALPGQTVTYTITASNVGAGPANNVQILDPLPSGATFLNADANGALVNATTVGWNLGTLAPQATATVHLQVAAPSTATGGTLSNIAQVQSAELSSPVQSNGGIGVTTTVAPATPAVSPFAGTWSSLPPGVMPPVAHHASLTVDAQGRFTVWSRSQDNGQTVSHFAQGVLSPSGAFDVTSTDPLVQVHFAGQIAADHQTAQITVARAGFVTYTITAPKRPDLNAVLAAFIGTFNGSAVAANSDRLQVVLSVDPGGNATLAADLIRANNTPGIRQFATLQVAPDGTLISSFGPVPIGQMQVVNGSLGLVNFQVTGYPNSFVVALSPFMGGP